MFLGNEKSDWKVEGFRLYLSMCFYSYSSSEIVSLHPPSLCQWIQRTCHRAIAVLLMSSSSNRGRDLDDLGISRLSTDWGILGILC